MKKEEIREKCMHIEDWVYRLRHLNEVALPDNDKLKFCFKRIEKNIEELGIMLGVEE